MNAAGKALDGARQGLQVWFLPWAGLRQEVKIGPVSIWPFSGDLPRKRVHDVQTRKHLRRYLRSFVDYRGKPVATTLVCSYGSVDFRRLSEDEWGDIRAAVDALVFSCICPKTVAAVSMRNNSVGPPSAELFQLFGTNFIPGDDSLAVRAGSVMHGGWKQGEVSFSMPLSTGGGITQPDQRLLAAFSNLLSSGGSNPAQERIIRSLEWFRFAHLDSDDVSPLSRIVMMATAFEILLGVPKTGDKSVWIADEVGRRCADSKALRETRASGRQAKDVTRPRVAWWAFDFYKLRNAIVHGDPLRPENLDYPLPKLPWMRYGIVADLLFWELLTRELFAHRWLGDDLRQDADDLHREFPGKTEPGLEDLLLAACMRYEDIHRNLGWTPPVEEV